jgi:two-component system cell cycle sensor histidine kinase/response regulator CckA
MNSKDLSDAVAKRWMIVDDDPGSLALTREMLSRLGMTRLECFTSPLQALAFKAAPECYELVITDFQMPKMDGVELSRRMLALAPKIKILLMSGGSFVNDETAVQEGFCGFLQKPFELQTLLRALAGNTSTDLSARRRPEL